MSSIATDKHTGTGIGSFNTAPPEFNPKSALSKGFLDFVLPLHRELTPRQQEFIRRRAEVLQASHQGRKPDYGPASEARTGNWKIQIPEWCADQRNQMTGPADDGFYEGSDV